MLATITKVMCDPPLHCFLVLLNIKNVRMICIYGLHQISWFGTQIQISIGRGERRLSWETQNLFQKSKLMVENVKINKTTDSKKLILERSSGYSLPNNVTIIIERIEMNLFTYCILNAKKI
jgi:hypothetical protein